MKSARRSPCDIPRDIQLGDYESCEGTTERKEIVSNRRVLFCFFRYAMIIMSYSCRSSSSLCLDVFLSVFYLFVFLFIPLISDTTPTNTYIHTRRKRYHGIIHSFFIFAEAVIFREKCSSVVNLLLFFVKISYSICSVEVHLRFGLVILLICPMNINEDTSLYKVALFSRMHLFFSFLLNFNGKNVLVAVHSIDDHDWILVSVAPSNGAFVRFSLLSSVDPLCVQRPSLFIFFFIQTNSSGKQSPGKLVNKTSDIQKEHLVWRRTVSNLGWSIYFDSWEKKMTRSDERLFVGLFSHIDQNVEILQKSDRWCVFRIFLLFDQSNPVT